MAWTELGATASITSIDLEIPLASLYENVEFPPSRLPFGVMEDDAEYQIV